MHTGPGCSGVTYVAARAYLDTAGGVCYTAGGSREAFKNIAGEQVAVTSLPSIAQ